jgi:cation diffusion facilitator family transporter
VLVSGKFSRKAKDEDHPYGHEKIDSMVSVFLGIAIIITAFEIGKTAVERLYGYFFEDMTLAVPTMATLIVALAVIAVKEVMYHLTKDKADKARSQALEAMAYDHRSDELASLGVAVGIGGARLGMPFLEPIASFFIALFVFRVGFMVIRSGFSQVVDQSADPDLVDEIEQFVEAYDSVCGVDDIKMRMFGRKYFIDLEIRLAHDLSLEKAHAIAEAIHDDLEARYVDVKHCMIHINPDHGECDMPD